MAKQNNRKLKGTEELVLLKNATSFNRISSYGFCPIRIAHDGTVVASIKGNFKKIYRGHSDQIYCFQEDSDFQSKYVTISKEAVYFHDLPNILEINSIIQQKLKNMGISFNLKKTQYFTQLFLTGSDDVIESLILNFSQKNLNIQNFEDGTFENEFRNDQTAYTWKLRFSSLLNVDRLFRETVSFFEVTPIEELDVKPSKKREESTKTVEQNKPIEVTEKVLINKITKEHKILRDFIYHSFNKIAFHPDFLTTIVQRFENVAQLTRILTKLNSGEDIKLKKIQKSSSANEWREVAEHIGDGRTKKGRIYVRRASIHDCSFDLYLDWKKDDKSQSRAFSRIAKLQPFESREVFYQ